MTQEEIREGLEHVITVNHPYIASKIAEEVVKYLHSQRVVLKVDRELPEESPTQLQMDIHQILIKYLNDKIALFDATAIIEGIYKQAGYEVVESLIKEGR